MNRIRQCSVILAVLVAMVLLIGACGGKVSKGDAPKWYLNPPDDKDKIYGTGASEKTQSLELGKQVADGNARNSLASTIQVNVQSMLRTYLQQSGTMEEARALQFSESVSKQVVDVKLTGVVISKREIKEGRWFSLAEVSKDSVNNALLSAVRDAAAEYSELKAKSALEDLEKAVSKGQ